MSDLQRSFAKAKLANLPLPDIFDEKDAEEEAQESIGELRMDHSGDDDSSSASSASSTGTIIPTPTKHLFARPNGSPNKKTLEPIPWTVYFERELFLDDVDAANDMTITHHIYLTSPTGSAPLFVMHHGAGSSGLSFAVLAAEIRKLLPGAGILSPDARGHGLTTIIPSTASNATPTSNKEPVPELSLPTLSRDLIAVIRKTAEAMSWSTLPPIILIGHSLGGAVVVDVASSSSLSKAILGYCVLDVVEGSAIDALQSMQTYLSTRPSGFPTIASGIDWHIRSRTIRNSTSARTSVPSLLQAEENEHKKVSRPWTWRTDLSATHPFWEGWFVGLSKKFLEAKGGKMLLLAGTDRLDKELMIGQMQGKYALQVFPEAGHFIHEDLPQKTAIAVVDFYKRNDRSALVLPPKVSDMLKAGRTV